MTHEVLTTDEAADYLRITRQTLMKLVNEGKIRAKRVSRHYRFLKSELENYLLNDESTGKEYDYVDEAKEKKEKKGRRA